VGLMMKVLNMVTHVVQDCFTCTYILDTYTQGGVGKKIKHPGSDFFLRPPGQGLTN